METTIETLIEEELGKLKPADRNRFRRADDKRVIMTEMLTGGGIDVLLDTPIGGDDGVDTLRPHVSRAIFNILDQNKGFSKPVGR